MHGCLRSCWLGKCELELVSRLQHVCLCLCVWSHESTLLPALPPKTNLGVHVPCAVEWLWYTWRSKALFSTRNMLTLPVYTSAKAVGQNQLYVCAQDRPSHQQSSWAKEIIGIRSGRHAFVGLVSASAQRSSDPAIQRSSEWNVRKRGEKVETCVYRYIFFSNYAHPLRSERLDVDMHIDLDTVVQRTPLLTLSEPGCGLVVSPSLGLLVVSCDDALHVFALPDGTATLGTGTEPERDMELVSVCTLGGALSSAPMKFKFCDGQSVSGCMVFLGTHDSPILVVTDAGHSAVHIVDVTGVQSHLGYVAAPGSIVKPRCVAASGSLVAVSAWDLSIPGTSTVRLFEGSGATWTLVREIASTEFLLPFGLRFTSDGLGLVVADPSNDRVCMFRVENGAFMGHVAMGTGTSPIHVEECGGGWLVACWDSVKYVRLGNGNVKDDSHPVEISNRLRVSFVSSLAVVPGLGLVVLRFSKVHFFFTPVAIAMAAMSPCRVAWMVAIGRVIHWVRK